MLIGRGEKIRTSDPHNPIVVRYQAAPRPDRVSFADNEARAAIILAALGREKSFTAAGSLELVQALCATASQSVDSG